GPRSGAARDAPPSPSYSGFRCIKQRWGAFSRRRTALASAAVAIILAGANHTLIPPCRNRLPAPRRDRGSMSQIRKVCVYCGSGPGRAPDFVLAARTFGKILADSGVGLVYGGGSVGLMGEIATSVLENGGHITGIIPDFLANREHMIHRGEVI